MPKDRAIMLAVLLTTLLTADPAPFYTDKQDLLHYIDPNGQSHPITTPEDWAIRRAHILANMQTVMGDLPEIDHDRPLDIEILEETHHDGYIRRKIHFTPEPNDRLPAYLLLPDPPVANAPAMLCLHPTSPRGKDVVVGLTDAPNRNYAEELAQRGYVTLAPDYPTMGDYDIDVYAMGYASATMKAIVNHIRSVDLLASLPEVDPNRIGAIGHSLGGHNALFLAAFDSRIKVAVSSCGFNRFAKYYNGDLTGWSHKGYMPRIATHYGKDPNKMPFDWTEILAAIAPRPVFVNAPLNDANFEVSGVKDCESAARPIYQLHNATQNLTVTYPNAEHDFPEETRQAAYNFIDAALQ